MFGDSHVGGRVLVWRANWTAATFVGVLVQRLVAAVQGSQMRSA